MFLKNKNIIFKTRRSKVTDYAALRVFYVVLSATFKRAGPEVIKLFILNSTEHEIYPADKC